MKIGDKLRCVYSEDDTYTVGQFYAIENFDGDGDPCLRDNEGDIDFSVGQPLNGALWMFEAVKP